MNQPSFVHPPAGAQAAIGIISLGCFAFMVFAVFWIVTLANILKSDFKHPSNKIAWLLAVIFVAPLGVILYWAIGRGQRVIEDREERFDSSYRGRRRD